MFVSVELLLEAEFVPAGEVALPRLVMLLLSTLLLVVLLLPLVLVPVWSLVPP